MTEMDRNEEMDFISIINMLINESTTARTKLFELKEEAKKLEAILDEKENNENKNQNNIIEWKTKTNNLQDSLKKMKNLQLEKENSNDEIRFEIQKLKENAKSEQYFLTETLEKYIKTTKDKNADYQERYKKFQIQKCEIEIWKEKVDEIEGIFKKKKKEYEKFSEHKEKEMMIESLKKRKAELTKNISLLVT